MSFLIFAAPIIFIIIFVIFIAVFSSDSKKYRRNLDNNKQMQLDEARENALKAVEKIRRNKNESNYSNGTSSTASSTVRTSVQTVSEQNNQSTLNTYQEYYNKHYNRGTSKFRQQRNFQNINNSAAGDTPTLVFAKENLVRGLIAKEYLNKKYGGRK